MRSLPILLAAAALLLPVHAQEPDPLDAAGAAAGRLVIDRLRRDDPAAYERLRRCPREGVLLVGGCYDHTDRPLRALGVPFRTVTPEACATVPLDRVRLLIIDCPGRIDRAAVDRVAAWVGRGGTLLTTDWALLHVLEHAFPGKVRWTRVKTRDDVVRLSSVADDPLLRRVFGPGRLACWWLERESYPLAVLARDVRVLLASHEMEHRYGAGTLGVTFRHGRGRVVHLVSHTYLQRNERRDPWEERPFLSEAKDLGFDDDLPAVESLRRDPAAPRLRAGDVNAMAGAQQLLLNVLAAALELPADPEVSVPRDPPAPPDAGEGPRPGPPDRATLARDLRLLDAPDGTPFLFAPRGLRVTVLSRSGPYLQVRTPAGQTGWAVADGVAAR